MTEPTTPGPVDHLPELADTSVWARQSKPGLEWFGTAVTEGRVAVCDMVSWSCSGARATMATSF